VDSPDLPRSIPSQWCERYLNTLGSLGICGVLGSGVRGAGSSDLSLPTGVGVATSHSAPLEHRTLCCAGDGEHPSAPAPVGPPEAVHCGLVGPPPFSCLTVRDNVLNSCRLGGGR